MNPTIYCKVYAVTEVGCKSTEGAELNLKGNILASAFASSHFKDGWCFGPLSIQVNACHFTTDTTYTYSPVY